MAVDQASAIAVLAACFRRGDEEALLGICRGVCQELCAILARKYRRIPFADIEAIVNFAAWHAWRKRRKYDAKRGTFDAWLYSIANRGCIDFLRRKTRHFELTVDPALLSRLPDPRSTAVGDGGQGEIEHEKIQSEEPAAASRSCEITRAALAALPDRQREILIADGRSSRDRADTHEIAVLFGVSDSAIRQARLRGMRRLRKELLSLGIEQVIGKSRAERMTDSRPIRHQNGKRKNHSCQVLQLTRGAPERGKRWCSEQSLGR